ncbi:glycosyltransferase [Rhodococcoides fascians]|uniref:glycosyltransferase n=1 Tax=Rhodococcoides fascians TaxID=1828 RepID=UPI00050C7380|nr:glycosyltransferase [Rhodococcus fascians]
MDENRRKGVTVVIPVRNAVVTLGAQLDALAVQDHGIDFEVIISDNGSTDGLREFLGTRPDDYGLQVRYVDASGSAGVSHARNVGASFARTDLLAFCDADDVVRPQWLSELVALASTADLVSGSLDTSRVNPPAVYRRRPMTPSTTGLDTDFLPYVPGCNFAVWADVFHAVHGFDETLTEAGEDLDFSWRVQLAGFRMAHAGAATVDYRLRPTMREFWSQVRRYAVGDVQLYVAYRDYGLAGLSVRVFSKHVLRLLVTNPLVPQRVSRVPRERWIAAVAVVVGHVQGSIRYRTLFL